MLGSIILIYIYIYINICIYTHILYAVRVSAEATKAWRLETSATGARFLLFGVIGGLCGVVGDPLVCLGVPGGSPGASRDYLGCPWSSWEFVDGPWGALRSQGLPGGLWKSLKKQFVSIVFS